MKLHYIILSITLMSVINFAQPYNDPMKFFPAKVDNMWEYLFYSNPSDTIQRFVLKDSLDINNTKYIWLNSRIINPIQYSNTSLYWIDTLFNVYGYYDDTVAILYKLAANQEDQWVIRRYSHTFEMIRVDTVYEENLFGTNSVIKAYRNYLAFDSTETTGLDRSAQLLAYGFGLVTVYGLEGFGDWYIKGTVIDGTLYGDTTQIITSIFDIKQPLVTDVFSIQQNYPNPFNSETNIHFTVESSTALSIKVYDVLGNEIRTLVENKDYYPGFYKINWDGKDDFSKPLTSGVYFYKIYNNKKSIFKKMILLK